MEFKFDWTRFGSMEFMSLDFESHSNVFTQSGNYYVNLVCTLSMIFDLANLFCEIYKTT